LATTYTPYLDSVACPAVDVTISIYLKTIWNSGIDECECTPVLEGMRRRVNVVRVAGVFTEL